jgi:hypothetical protein
VEDLKRLDSRLDPKLIDVISRAAVAIIMSTGKVIKANERGTSFNTSVVMLGELVSCCLSPR